MINATIIERGNGMPDVGTLVPGNDGNLYRIETSIGHIQTGGPGEGYRMAVTVSLADWSDAESDDDVYPCTCVIPTDDE